MNSPTIRGLTRFARRPQVAFGGVYGTILASTMVAALTQYPPPVQEDRLYDATWLMITVFAAAIAHGYSHILADRGEEGHPRGYGAFTRTLLDEWPMVVFALPAALLLFGAGVGWWESQGIEYVAFVTNIVLLFAWGLLTNWSAGRGRRSALLTATADAFLGVLVVILNALVK